MRFIIGLHIFIEGIIGLLLLFYPAVANLLPGFADAAGDSYQMLLKMYGLAALFLAAIGGLALWKSHSDAPTAFLLVLLLSSYHFAMALVQFGYNPDTRAALLHFLLGIFLAAIFVRREEIKQQMKH